MSRESALASNTRPAMTNTTLPTDYARSLSSLQLLTYVSDISKEVLGFRERGLSGLTRHQLLLEAAYFERKIDEAQEEDIDANWHKYA